MPAPAQRNLFSIVALLFLFSCFIAGCSPKQRALEERLQKLEDREEIRQLLFDYGRFLDQRDFFSFSRLFAGEGEWIGGMGQAKGPLAIRKLMENSIGNNGGKPNTSNFHIFTNPIIRLDGNQATATTKWVFVVRSENNQPRLFFLGHYEDSLVREGRQWKFLRRNVCTDIPPDGSMPEKIPGK